MNLIFIENKYVNLTIIDKSNKRTLNNLGQRIREVRENQQILLRQVAAYLEVDTALISKAERGERSLNREQVVKLAIFLKGSEEELISLWLCDKIISVVGNDNYAIQGTQKALKIIKKKLINECN
jgi:transcriptional regulator with XRE-family HTH domain